MPSADNASFFIPSTQEAVGCLSRFISSASIFGLRVSWPKTKIQNTGSGTQPSNITVNGNIVEQVDNSIYPVSNQSSDGGSQSDVKRRIALASAAMLSLWRIWSDQYLCLPTKLRVYQTLVLPMLTYACETWTLLAADIKRLEAFHMKYQLTPNGQDPLAGPCVATARVTVWEHSGLADIAQ